MWEITLKFDQVKVTQAEDDYKKLTISPDIRQFLEQSAQLIQNFIQLPVMAIRGNAWYSIKTWQKKYKKSIVEIAKMSPAERLNTAKELFDIGKERMMNMLVKPEEQKELLDEAYEKIWQAYQHYVKNH